MPLLDSLLNAGQLVVLLVSLHVLITQFNLEALLIDHLLSILQGLCVLSMPPMLPVYLWEDDDHGLLVFVFFLWAPAVLQDSGGLVLMLVDLHHEPLLLLEAVD